MGISDQVMGTWRKGLTVIRERCSGALLLGGLLVVLEFHFLKQLFVLGPLGTITDTGGRGRT